MPSLRAVCIDKTIMSPFLHRSPLDSHLRIPEAVQAFCCPFATIVASHVQPGLHGLGKMFNTARTILLALLLPSAVTLNKLPAESSCDAV